MIQSMSTESASAPSARQAPANRLAFAYLLIAGFLVGLLAWQLMNLSLERIRIPYSDETMALRNQMDDEASNVKAQEQMRANDRQNAGLFLALLAAISGAVLAAASALTPPRIAGIFLGAVTG